MSGVVELLFYLYHIILNFASSLWIALLFLFHLLDFIFLIDTKYKSNLFEHVDFFSDVVICCLPIIQYNIIRSIRVHDVSIVDPKPHRNTFWDSFSYEFIHCCSKAWIFSIRQSINFILYNSWNLAQSLNRG